MASAAQQIAADDPPTLRRGRHRDGALASWRRTQAIELRLAGKTYQQIADELGYGHRGTVSRIVQQTLDKREVEDVALLRETELARLNEVQAALWDRMEAGDVRAAMLILGISDRRCRLLGLFPDRVKHDPKAAWDNCAGPATVVVRADDCRHEGCFTHGKFASP